MNPKHSRPSRHPAPAESPEPAESKPSSAKALTVNVPIAVLNLAKTRASLDGTTMSAVVTGALTIYAAGLQGVLSQLGLDRPTR
jgi:hypothetical protein